MSAVLKALVEPRRREILRLVWSKERAAGEIAERVDVTFSAVSQHLTVLRLAGLVEVRREGRRRLYRARRDRLDPSLSAWLQASWRTKLDDLKRLAEEEEARA